MYRFILIGCVASIFSSPVRSQIYDTIEVNKRNQKTRASNDFAVEVSDGSYDRVNFTVQVKKGPVEAMKSPLNSRIEIMEGGKAIGMIPIERRARSDGGDHFVQFELSPELAEKCILVLVETVGDTEGKIYRVDLYSYTKQGADKARPIMDEIVLIEFPKDGYTYTLDQVAKGVKIEYKVVVTKDYEGVIALPVWPSNAEPAADRGPAKPN